MPRSSRRTKRTTTEPSFSPKRSVSAEISPEEMVRLEVLRLFRSRCVHCGKKTTTVHEIVPRSAGNKFLLDLENRVPVCAYIHERIHREGTPTWELRLRKWRQSALQDR